MKSNSLNTTYDESWSSIADMMAGLMIIFLFIAISYMVKVGETASKYASLKSNIRSELSREFEKDFKRWNAEIPPGTLTIRFKDPEVLFSPKSSELKPEFKAMLSSFYPRYVRIISDKEFASEIEEVRIEGHTSSGWLGKNAKAAYFHNLKLSQERTRSVAEYISRFGGIVDRKAKWLRSIISANGYSSSRLILKKNGREDYKRSRRVEFSIKLKTDKKLSSLANRKS